jgi:hypothetical protein
MMCQFSSSFMHYLALHCFKFRVRVTLRLTVYRQSVRFGAKNLEDHDQRFFYFAIEPLRYVTSSLTREDASSYQVIPWHCNINSVTVPTQLQMFLYSTLRNVFLFPAVAAFSKVAILPAHLTDLLNCHNYTWIQICCISSELSEPPKIRWRLIRMNVFWYYLLLDITCCFRDTGYWSGHHKNISMHCGYLYYIVYIFGLLPVPTT